MRKMATIQKISEIKPIPEADRICAYRVNGWWIVDAVGKYDVSDRVIYCEIDSWIPNSIAPFLSKGVEPREYLGVKGERLRTIRLRKQISQGLILPVSILTNYGTDYKEDDDVSEILNIVKYEPPVSPQLAGLVKGSFPSFIPKTDQERIQNLIKNISEWSSDGSKWEVTEKLEGSSMTVYLNEDNGIGVCSRNLELKFSEDNSFWKTALSHKLDQILVKFGRQIALQGELVGEGVQGNIYALKGLRFYVYDIYDIKEGRYWTSNERIKFVETYGLFHVPVLQTEYSALSSLQTLLDFSNIKSYINPKTDAEGLVWKKTDGTESFKVISDTYLLKQG